MSYDLMVFDKEAAPTRKRDFLKWYDVQVKWSEEHKYNDPIVTTPELRNWFMDMVRTYPAMNGPYAVHEESDYVSDYCIGRDVIYIGFAWPLAEQAFKSTMELAQKHGVGFFDVSANDGAILFPHNGELLQISDYERLTSSSNAVARPWWRFW